MECAAGGNIGRRRCNAGAARRTRGEDVGTRSFLRSEARAVPGGRGFQGFPPFCMNVPVNEPIITAESKEYVNEAMDSGWISSAVKYIAQFYPYFTAFLGVKHGITTTNGTSALHLALATPKISPRGEGVLPHFFI